MAKTKLAKHNKLKNYGLALGSFIIAFILGSLLFLPLFDRRTGFDVLSSMLGSESKTGNNLGDESKDNIVLQPYDYIQSKVNGGFSYYKPNVTYYRNWLNTTVVWRVEKSLDGKIWVDYKKFEVKKVWDSKILSEKHTVIVNSDADAYYRILTNTVANADLISYDDLSAKSIEDGKSNEYSLNFKVSDTKNYDLVYNWDDYLSSPINSTSTFSKTVKMDSVSSKPVFEFSVVSNVKIRSGASFILDPTYGLIADAVTNSWEYDGQEGKYPDMIRLGTSQYYAIVSTGDSGTENDGYIRTIQVWNSNGTIKTSLIDSLEYDAKDGIAPSICLVYGDIYAISYYSDTDNYQTIVTVSIDDADGQIGAATIDKQSLTYDSIVASRSKILNMGNNIFAVVYTQVTSTNLYLETWTIATDGTITNTVVDSVEINASDGTYPDMRLVDSDTVAVVYCGTGSDGYLSTWNISAAGDITATYASEWEFDTSNGVTPTIAKVTGNIFMIAYKDSSNSLYVKTTTIANTGAITKSWADTQLIETYNGDYPTFFNVSINSITNKWIKGISYSGDYSNDDNWVSTFDVTSAGIIGSEINTVELTTADTVAWYQPVCFVSGFYFLIINQDSQNDGWAKTFQIYSNNPPTLSNPVPVNSATGISTTPQLNVDVADIGDYSISSNWYSNSSGTWQQFGGVNATMGYGAISDANINTWEYDQQEGLYPDAIKLGSDGTYSYYAIVSTGDAGSELDGYIRTIKVLESTGVITTSLIDSYEYDTTDGIYPSIVYVSGNIYAIVYYDDTANYEKVVTVSITSLGDIDTVTGIIDTLQLTYDSTNLYPSKIINVNGNVFCALYSKISTNQLCMETLWINNSGTINNTVLDTQVVASGSSWQFHPGMCSVDSDTIAILWKFGGAYAEKITLNTWNISSSGIITDTYTDQWQDFYGDVNSQRAPYILKISSNIFALFGSLPFWEGDKGVVVTCTIADTGMITKTAISKGNYWGGTTSYPYYQTVLSLGNNLYAITGHDSGSGDGWVTTIKIDSTGIVSESSYDDLEFDTADSIFFAPILPVANDYYLIVYEGTDDDGWTATIKIENSTNTTIRQTNSNFSAGSTKYWWSINCTDGVQWTNETFCFTTAAGGVSRSWQMVSTWNGTIYNQSSFNQVADFNGTIYNQSNWNQISLFNGTIYNTSSWHQINLWNGTLFNSSQWNFINEYNGTIYNATVKSWQLVQEFNGTIFNQSLWNQINLWNGSIFNISLYHIIQDINGTVFNTSSYSQIALWNGTIYNISMGFSLVNEWNGSIFNQSSFNQIADWNGTVFNTSEYTQVNLWNGTLYNQSSYHLINEFNGSIYNISIGFALVQEWNGSIYNQSSWYGLEWNGTIFNSSSYSQIGLWNGSIFNQSSFHLIQEFNGSIYNTSIGFIQIQNWNGSIWNQSNWNQIDLWNGTVYNASSYYLIQDWNGTLFNQSTYHLIQEFNGTIYNTSIGFILVNDWNGSIWNQSTWQDQNWNGTIYNASSYSQINNWNGSLFNQSTWHQLSLWNGSIYNVSIGFVLVQNWNGTIWNQSSWQDIEWNGSIYNTSGYNQINLWNGTLYNQSSYHLINEYNGTIFNVSIGFVLVQNWNGTIWNQSSWQDVEWNGTIYNESNFVLINFWNGTIYNQSTYHLIQEFNGTIYNTSIGFVLIDDWNGSIYNQSSWQDIDWNGSIYNASGYNQINLWNGTIYNASNYHLIQEWNGTIYNVSIGFVLVNDWNGSLYNQSAWNLIDEWFGSIYSQTAYNEIQDWNGSIFNQSQSHIINTWNGSLYNTSSFNAVNDWNGTIFNSSSFNLINQWNGSLYNQSVWNPISQWNGTIYNVSIGFVLIQDWNGTIYNQSSWLQISMWNGTIFNTSAFELVSNWNGTVYNQSQPHEINLWNGTIFNISIGFALVQEWNGTIFNASIFNQINLWNGSIFNTSFYFQINNWNGTIYNTTGAIFIQEWNGSIYNGTGLGAIITLSNPYPGNNSNHIKINVTLSITIHHLNGNQMNITWYWGNSSANATHYLGSTLNVANGTYSMAIAPANHTYTDYWWNVNVTSGSDYASSIYNFTTGMKSGMIMTRDRFIIGISIGIIVIFGFLGVLLYRRKSRYEE